MFRMCAKNAASSSRATLRKWDSIANSNEQASSSLLGNYARYNIVEFCYYVPGNYVQMCGPVIARSGKMRFSRFLRLILTVPRRKKLESTLLEGSAWKPIFFSVRRPLSGS